jgi:uncharacterized RDD family membrane protein YckC
VDRTLSVKTPESIAFSYDLAGLGSRFLALAIDMAIQIAILVAIFYAIFLIGTHAPPAHKHVHDSAAESAAIAFIVAIIFLVFFAYFIIFEAFWNGQTPGKRLMHLRVVRDGGYPLDFAGSAIRNLVRVGEVALGFYGISAIASIFSPENKRLGDLAAGTVVVRDGRLASLSTVMENAADAPRTTLLSEQEHKVIDQFVTRRKGLTPAVRAAIAERIAQQVRPRVSYDLQALSDEELLVRLSAS